MTVGFSLAPPDSTRPDFVTSYHGVSTKNLENVIMRIWDLAKEFDVGAMVKETAGRYKKLLGEKGIQLSIHSPTTDIRLVGDPAKVGRVFQNLLHNAVKFTLRGEIAVKVHRSVNRGVIDLEITDTGIGIPRDQIEGMFQPFQQMNGSFRREFSGMGLGLTVARRLTDFLGGSLEIRSQPDIGTHVLLSIPYRAATQKNGTSDH